MIAYTFRSISSTGNPSKVFVVPDEVDKDSVSVYIRTLQTEPPPINTHILRKFKGKYYVEHSLAFWNETLEKIYYLNKVRPE